MLKIFPVDRNAAPGDYSMNPEEQEFVISPYQGFYLRGVTFDSSFNRWIVELVGMRSASPESWFHLSSSEELEERLERIQAIGSREMAEEGEEEEKREETKTSTEPEEGDSSYCNLL
jgi:hypothetical protein